MGGLYSVGSHSILMSVTFALHFCRANDGAAIKKDDFDGVFFQGHKDSRGTPTVPKPLIISRNVCLEI